MLGCPYSLFVTNNYLVMTYLHKITHNSYFLLAQLHVPCLECFFVVHFTLFFLSKQVIGCLLDCFSITFGNQKIMVQVLEPCKPIFLLIFTRKHHKTLINLLEPQKLSDQSKNVIINQISKNVIINQIKKD